MTLIKKILSRFPSRLPQGMTEFERFIDDVAELSGLPINNKLRAVVSQFIFTLPPQMSHYPKQKLANQLQKAAANQVASEVLSKMNDEKKAELQSASDKMGQEVTGHGI